MLRGIILDRKVEKVRYQGFTCQRKQTFSPHSSFPQMTGCRHAVSENTVTAKSHLRNITI